MTARPAPSLADGAMQAPPLAQAAVFIDFDGTLAPIVAHPALATLPPEAATQLQRLYRATGGALAIVTGRSLPDLDARMAPLRLPAAGLHGAQWRDAQGREGILPVDAAPVEEMARSLQAYADAHPGVLVERKPLAVAVHYRGAPALAADVRRLAESTCAQYADAFCLQAGKMVLEIKPRAANKGEAIRRFMQLPPFAGRIPVYAGDDLTDEAGFLAVNAMGGVSIKIGQGDTAAQLALPGTQAFLRWLSGWH